MFSVFGDEHYMKMAIKEAVIAYESGEVPVGAVVVTQNQIIAKSHNLTQKINDVTAHAEMQAITAASDFLGSKYLTGCTLYVTLEPCIMCAGALKWSQISRIVYGASDEKEGFMRYGKELLHPRTKVEMGLLEAECSQLLKNFFKKRRVESKL